MIGRSGRRIAEITEEIKKEFGFENPLIDVRQVEQPFLDANKTRERAPSGLPGLRGARKPAKRVEDT